MQREKDNLRKKRHLPMKAELHAGEYVDCVSFRVHYEYVFHFELFILN